MKKIYSLQANSRIYPVLRGYLHRLFALALLLSVYMPASARQVVNASISLPDLTITDIWNQDALLCYQILNQGVAASPAGHATQLDLDGSFFAIDVVDSALKPLERVERCFNAEWACTLSQDTFQVCADSKDSVQEGDENNNCRQETWNCDATPPQFVQGPLVQEISETSAVIYWLTDEPADSLVEYSQNAGAYDHNVLDQKFTLIHKLNLSGLTPASVYQYRALSSDPSGNQSSSQAVYFKTLPLKDPQPPDNGASEIKRRAGEYLAFDFSVPVLDDQGVDRVELSLDGIPVGIDYAPDPGSTSYRFTILPGALGFSHLDFFKKPHTLEIKSFDRAGGYRITSSPWAPAVEPMDGEIDILSPGEGYTIYIADETAPFLTHVPIQVYAAENVAELCPPPGIGGDADCARLTQAVSKVEFYINSVLLHTSIPADPNQEIHTYTWDASFKPLGDYQLRVIATADDGSTLTTTRMIYIRSGEAHLTMERSVSRVNTWFRVQLTVRNIGTLPVILFDMQDTLTGFQVLPRDTAYFSIQPSFNHWLDTTSVTIDLFEPGLSAYRIEPGESYSVEYTAVPYLRMPDFPVTYAIGAEPLLLSTRVDYVDTVLSYDLPCLWTADSLRMPEAVAQAQSMADYLIVTNPELLDFHNASSSDVDWLLTTLAELAVVKQGAIGYTEGFYNDRVVDETIENWGASMKGSDGTPGGFLRDGYLLLVGESEIVPTGSIFLSGFEHHLSDFRYADTASNEIDPELRVGRIIGNNAFELIMPLHTIINVYRGASGFGYDRSNALLVSGWPESRGGGSDTGDFLGERNDVQSKLSAQGVASTLMNTPDYETANLSALTFLYLAQDKDIIHLTGHGNTGSWDDISSSVLDLEPDPFGEANPIVYGSSCLTGQYTAGTSLAEKFLQKGAGAYLGANSVSYIISNRAAANAIYQRLDPGRSLGAVLNEVKTGIGSDDWYGFEEDAWTLSYHLYGDPEYGADLGFVPDAPVTKSVLTFSDRPFAPKESIPAYKVTPQADGTHWVEIPGGGWVMVPGMPVVPDYGFDFDVPSEYMVQQVRLTKRDGLSTASGFNLPLFTTGLAGGPLYPMDRALSGGEWWPERDFSWIISRNPDGSSRLHIQVYPFYYNSLTGQVRFFQNYEFEILSLDAWLKLVDLQLDQAAYLPGKDIRIDVQISNPVSVLDSFLALKILRPGEEQVVAGLPLQPLNGLSGNALTNLVWNPGNLPNGDYVLQAELFDLAGHHYDTRQVSFTIGVRAGDIEGLSISSTVFMPGQAVQIAYGFRNKGTLPLDGQAVIEVQDLSSGEELRHKQEFAALQPGQVYPVNWTWQSNIDDRGQFRVIAYVQFDPETTPPSVVMLRSYEFIYLPVVSR